MGKSVLYLLCVFLIPSLALAQDTSFHQKFALKTEGLSIVNPDFPAFTLSGEFFLSRYASLEFEAGYSNIQPLGISSDTNFVTPFILKLNGELKYFIPPKTGRTRAENIKPYFALEGFFQYARFNASVSNADTVWRPEKINPDNFIVDKKILGFNFKWGEELWLADNHLILDGWVGIGLRSRTVLNGMLDIEGPRGYLDAHSIHGFDEYRESGLFSGSSGIRINLPIGFKVGYLF